MILEPEEEVALRAIYCGRAHKIPTWVIESLEDKGLVRYVPCVTAKGVKALDDADEPR